LEIVLILTTDRSTVCTERTIASSIVLDAPDGNSLVTWVVWNLIFIRLETMLVSAQDRCTVCTEHSIGIEIFLDALNETPR
jgi:uncharacterized protein with PIN domain